MLHNYDMPSMTAYKSQENEFLQIALDASVSAYKIKWVMRLVMSSLVKYE